jgi:hypothetical protein
VLAKANSRFLTSFGMTKDLRGRSFSLLRAHRERLHHDRVRLHAYWD